MKDPFLLRFKKSCFSKQVIDENAFFDPALDMVIININNESVTAIHAPNNHSLGTKKADLEKGEDQKDSLMWR